MNAALPQQQSFVHAPHYGKYRGIVTDNQDPITRGGDHAFQRDVPGCSGQPHTTIEGAGHFLQEDRGEELARVIVDWIATL